MLLLSLLLLEGGRCLIQTLMITREILWVSLLDCCESCNLEGVSIRTHLTSSRSAVLTVAAI